MSQRNRHSPRLSHYSDPLIIKVNKFKGMKRASKKQTTEPENVLILRIQPFLDKSHAFVTMVPR